jgi:hypothetical protein
MAKNIEHVWLEIDGDNIIIAIHSQQPNTKVITQETGNLILETDVEDPITLIGLDITELNTPVEDRPERGNPCSAMLKRMMFLQNKRIAYEGLGFDKSGKLYRDLENEITTLMDKYTRDRCPIA